MDNCKICGNPMYNFECYNSEYYLGEHREYISAYCPHCDKDYRWIEIFKFDRIEEFKEDI